MSMTVGSTKKRPGGSGQSTGATSDTNSTGPLPSGSALFTENIRLAGRQLSSLCYFISKAQPSSSVHGYDVLFLGVLHLAIRIEPCIFFLPYPRTPGMIGFKYLKTSQRVYRLDREEGLAMRKRPPRRRKPCLKREPRSLTLGLLESGHLGLLSSGEADG